MLSSLVPQHDDGSFLVQLGTIGRPNLNGFIYAPIDPKVLEQFNTAPRVGGLGQRIVGKKKYGDGEREVEDTVNYGVPDEDVAFTLESVEASDEIDPTAPLGKLQHLRARMRLSGPKSEELRKLIEEGKTEGYFGLRAISAVEGFVGRHRVYEVKEILSWDLLSENPYPA